MSDFLIVYLLVGIGSGALFGYLAHDDPGARITEPLLCAALWPMAWGVLVGSIVRKCVK